MTTFESRLQQAIINEQKRETLYAKLLEAQIAFAKVERELEGRKHSLRIAQNNIEEFEFERE
jgi:hypothetical protein